MSVPIVTKPLVKDQGFFITICWSWAYETVFNSFRTFAGKFCSTESYDSLIRVRSSVSFSADFFRTHTQPNLPVYGAEMIPSRSMSFAYISGEHLKEQEKPLAGFRLAVANILSPMQKHRSLPHFISSCAFGNDKQYSRNCSTFIISYSPVQNRTKIGKKKSDKEKIAL